MKKIIFLISLIFIFLILTLVLSGTYFVTRYQQWEREFNKDLKSEYIVNSQSTKDIKIDERIAKFILSLEDTQSLTLTPKEVGVVLFSTVDEYLEEDFHLNRMYIVPSENKWMIYIEVRYKDTYLWFSFDLNKDDIQSAQIYTTSVNIGPFNLNEYTKLVDMINTGISEAIVSLNENGFLGRYVENIELLQEGLVLKGSRY